MVSTIRPHLSSSPLCLSLSCLFLSPLFARKTQCFSWLPEFWSWQMRGECERWGGEKGNRVARRVFRSLLDKRMCSYNVVAADKSLKSCLCSADKEPPPPPPLPPPSIHTDAHTRSTSHLHTHTSATPHRLVLDFEGIGLFPSKYVP